MMPIAAPVVDAVLTEGAESVHVARNAVDITWVRVRINVQFISSMIVALGQQLQLAMLLDVTVAPWIVCFSARGGLLL